jgi:acetoin utilization transport system permease protein
MFHKVLWARNWKQSKYVIILINLLVFLTLPYRYITKYSLMYDETETHPELHLPYRELEYVVSDHPIYLPVAVILLISLATVLMSGERTSRGLEFQLSLPISRMSIFLSKWLFGVVHIGVALLVNLLITFAVIETTILDLYAPHKHLFKFFVLTGFIYVAIYSLSLMVGALTGRNVSQIAISLVLLYFVPIFTIVTAPFIPTEVWDPTLPNYTDIYHRMAHMFTLPEILRDYIVIYDYSYFTNYNVDSNYKSLVHLPSNYGFVSASIVSFVSLVVGLFAFTRNKVEQTGEFIIFPWLNKVFMIFASICVGLFAGTFTSGVSITYYVCIVIISILAYFLLQKLSRQRMNSMS